MHWAWNNGRSEVKDAPNNHHPCVNLIRHPPTRDGGDNKRVSYARGGVHVAKAFATGRVAQCWHPSPNANGTKLSLYIMAEITHMGVDASTRRGRSMMARCGDVIKYHGHVRGPGPKLYTLIRGLTELS